MPLKNYIRQDRQKGEVAWFLTIISMVTVGLGLVIGINSATSDQSFTRSTDAVEITEVDRYFDTPVKRVDGHFTSSGGVCKGSFFTQIDPPLQDILIARPQSLAFPRPGDDVFSLVEDGGMTDIVGRDFVKNYSIHVRFNPDDPDKRTPNPGDIQVTYKVPSQPDRVWIVDESKVKAAGAEWIYSSDTTIYLLWFPSKRATRGPLGGPYRYNTANSSKCQTTPTPEITTITPEPAACYDLCTTNAQCGSHVDPATGLVEKMLCLKEQKNPIAAPLSTTQFFFDPNSSTLQAEGDYPFTSEAVILDLDNGGKIHDYIPNTTWENSEGISDVFKDDSNRARVWWTTQNVPENLRDRAYDITLKGLPATYEIVDTFCINVGTPDTCKNFGSADGKKKITNISILKNGSVKYGWKIQKKKAPTAVPPTAVPPTSVPPTAVPPTAVPPTTVPQPATPTPLLCASIIGKVQAGTITAALANPSSVAGWGLGDDVTKPVGPSNPVRNKLSIKNINNPYHPTFNGLIFKAQCDTPTVPDPTAVPPTAAPNPTTAPDPTTGPQPTVPPVSGGHALCDPTTGENCRCMPPSCTGRDCSTKELACEAPTPTPECPPEECPLACEYNAITFVEECSQENINTTTGECNPIPGTNRFDASPIAQAEFEKRDDFWKMWAPQNDLQEKNSDRPITDKPSVQNLIKFIPRSDTNAWDALLERFAKFDFARNLTEGISISPRQFSRQDVALTDGRELLEPNNGILIASTDELKKAFPNPADFARYSPAEQYNNMQDATVQLFYNQDDYRILPNGKQIYSCTNDVAEKLLADGELDPVADADIIKMTTGVGACNMPAFNANKEQRDHIDGLTVGCGQRIVYGWTLHKCDFNFDYVFVVDTSSSMLVPDKNVGGQRKIDAAIDSLETMIDNIEASGTDSRIALVNFNNAVHVYNNDGSIKAGEFPGYGPGVRTNGLLDKSQFGSVRETLSRFRKTTDQGGLIEKGTCTRCGLNLANQILNTNRSAEEKDTRAGVVIFLSDGLPNAYPGDADPVLRAAYPPEANGNVVPWGWTGTTGTKLVEQGIYQAADELRNDGTKTPGVLQRTPLKNNNVFDDVLLIGVGYGDATLQGSDGQDFEAFIESIASTKADDTTRWAYSTDRTKGSEINIPQIFKDVEKDLNTCALSALAFDTSQKARDINGDGIINTIDLFLIYESYYTKGDNIDEDVNADGVVNALDVSLVLQSLGTVITPTDVVTE